MTTIVKEVYDAFISAGVDPEMAEKASSALIEHRTELEDVKRDLLLLKWMVGYIVAISTSVALKMLLS
ncbi:MAG: integrase [Methyloprofundus sp.]|nr:integrase [Methyloprofundus sp.]